MMCCHPERAQRAKDPLSLVSGAPRASPASRTKGFTDLRIVCDDADRSESDHDTTRHEPGFLIERPRVASIAEASRGCFIISSRLVGRGTVDAHGVIRKIAQIRKNLRS